MKMKKGMEELRERQQLITQEDLDNLNQQQPRDKVAQFQKKYLEYMKDYWENTQKIFLQVRDAERQLELIQPWTHVTGVMLEAARQAEIQARERRGIFFSGAIEGTYQTVLAEAREMDIRNQRADIEAYLDEQYGDDPEKRDEKNEARETFLWLAEKARARDQMPRDMDRMSYVHYYFGGSRINDDEKDILEGWEASQRDTIRKVMGPLESETGFANVDLSQMHPRFRYAILAALAAVEKVFHINERLRQRIVRKLQEFIKKSRGAVEDNAELEFRPEKQESLMFANDRIGIRYNSHPLKKKEIDLGVIGSSNAREYGYLANAGEGIAHDEIQIVLPFVLAALHECGHQYESCLADDCFKKLSPELKRLVGIPDIQKNLNSFNWALKEPQLDNELSILLEESKCFDAFVCREFMQYAMAITEKEFGEKPTAGLIFKPGGRAKSLSFYAKTNTKDFFAELFSQVLMTDFKYLTPLGKTLRKLLNSDGKPFIKWFVRKNAKDHGKAYQEHKKYYKKHDGYEKCPPFPSKINETDMLLWAIQMKQISNYNIAENWKQAEMMQKKLGDAAVISERLRKEWPDISDKFRTWQKKKADLIRMSEYCSSPEVAKSVIPESYSWLDILDTLAEKNPKDFESQKACEEFLDAQINSVEKELKKAKAQQASEPNLQAVPADMAVKIPLDSVDAAHPVPLVPVNNQNMKAANKFVNV